MHPSGTPPRYPDRPRVVIAASRDMSRTASTWAYNAVRLLYRHAKEACDSYWMRQLSREKLEARMRTGAHVLQVGGRHRFKGATSINQRSGSVPAQISGMQVPFPFDSYPNLANSCEFGRAEIAPTPAEFWPHSLDIGQAWPDVCKSNPADQPRSAIVRRGELHAQVKCWSSCRVCSRDLVPDMRMLQRDMSSTTDSINASLAQEVVGSDAEWNNEQDTNLEKVIQHHVYGAWNLATVLDARMDSHVTCVSRGAQWTDVPQGYEARRDTSSTHICRRSHAWTMELHEIPHRMEKSSAGATYTMGGDLFEDSGRVHDPHLPAQQPAAQVQAFLQTMGLRNDTGHEPTWGAWSGDTATMFLPVRDQQPHRAHMRTLSPMARQENVRPQSLGDTAAVEGYPL